MKRLLIALAAITLGTATAAAQTQNVTDDGKATTTRASNGTWNLRVNGKLIAIGLASPPTGGTQGIYIIEKPAGTKTAIDETGKKVEVQRITHDQMYNETLDRIERQGGSVIDEDRAIAKAAELKAENDRLIAAEKAKLDKRMNDVNPEIREVGNKRQLYIRGKMVIEGFDIMLLNDKMYSEKLSIHRGPDNLRDRGADFRWYWDGVDGNYFNLYKGLDDRYWFYLVDKSYSRERYYHENGYRHIMDDGTVERFDIIVKGEYDTGLIAVDTETGSYTVLLPFQYDITFTVNPRGITPIGGQPEVTSTINSRRQGQRGGGDNWRFDGSTQIVFRKQ